MEDGDEHAETVLHEYGTVVSRSQDRDTQAYFQLAVEPGKRDPGTESQFDYGSRAAIWRIMRIFKKYNIPITFYAVARAFERNTAIAEYAEAEGHEVASHCYKVSRSRVLEAYPLNRQWKAYTGMTDEEEEFYIRKAVESFKTTSPSGKVPTGVSGLKSVLAPPD